MEEKKRARGRGNFKRVWKKVCCSVLRTSTRDSSSSGWTEEGFEDALEEDKRRRDRSTDDSTSEAEENGVEELHLMDKRKKLGTEIHW